MRCTRVISKADVQESKAFKVLDVHLPAEVGNYLEVLRDLGFGDDVEEIQEITEIVTECETLETEGSRIPENAPANALVIDDDPFYNVPPPVIDREIHNDDYKMHEQCVDWVENHKPQKWKPFKKLFGDKWPKVCYWVCLHAREEMEMRIEVSLEMCKKSLL